MRAQLLVAALALSMWAAGCSSGSCPAPNGTLHVTVTAVECAACGRLAVMAQSPQISAAIAAGHTPCAESITGAPTGCAAGTIWIDTYLSCGSGRCGPYDVDLSSLFAPSISGAAPAITDTVSFCPFDSDGQGHFFAAGNCVSSFSNQCGGTIALNIDGTAGPGGSDAGASDAGTTRDGGAPDSGTCINRGVSCPQGTGCCGTDLCASGTCVQCKPKGSPCSGGQQGENNACCSESCMCNPGVNCFLDTPHYCQ